MEPLDQLLQTLPGAARLDLRADGCWMDAPNLDVTAMAVIMLDHEARLSTMTAIALDRGETEIIYHYVLNQRAFHFRVQTQKNRLVSITPVTPAADWIEREIADLYAVTFEGHPNPVRLLRPAQLQPGYFREPGGAAGKLIHNQP
jgi:NADH-quinone oxidoreductase subunit C